RAAASGSWTTPASCGASSISTSTRKTSDSWTTGRPCSRTATRSRSFPPSPEGAERTRVRISERVQGFTESVIREMTRVVSQYGGVNLAQGMPNFPPPAAVVEAAHRALDGDFHQYAITWGTPGL